MGMPAGRLTDNHVCPMVTGVVPHVGGPVVKFCPTVMICNMLSGRLTDMAVCAGPPDLVIKGSATCLIGSMPAARLLDNCAHGGMIVVGSPTVLIGG